MHPIALRRQTASLADTARFQYHAMLGEDAVMAQLKVTTKGQVTLGKEVLQHLGVKPGENMEIDLLPDGSAQLKPVQQRGSFEELAGILKDKTNGRVLSIEDLNDAIAEAGAARLAQR